MSDEEWMDVLNVLLNGTFKISKTVLKFMLKKRWGRIINITSTSATTGNRGQANYAAAKSGVEAFSRSLAKEVGSRGITVNSVAPGYIETDMTEQINNKMKEEILKQIPLSRFGRAEEVSQLIEFLITDEASYITGQTIHINGGLYM
jgi:3-oxoacyl-[acyl-carrier protein] reductase